MEHEFDNYGYEESLTMDHEFDYYGHDESLFDLADQVGEDYTDWDDVSDADADWRQEDYEERYYDEDAFTSAGWGMDESYGHYNEEW